MNTSQKVAVVTGGNRGLGFEASRQLAKQGYKVILTSRDEGKGKAAANKLQAEGLDVISYPLDVTSDDSSRNLAEFIRQQFGKLDVLVNNAAIYIDAQSGNNSILDTKIETLQTTIDTNVYGVVRVTQALIPLMKEQNYGRIVNVSSGMGQLTDMEGGSPGYRISKTALNAVTRIFASELRGTNILVNSVCPGWVKTDMGGANAPRTPEQGVDTTVWLATLPDNGTTGGFFRDRQPIDW
ncbi:SDR family oxidoreductase [Nostoc sp. FACHB-152]|uniref:SDR family oxidoreductase n=1 Tax=unclassified Nostoc TaxID=2593658 RepID=UPI001682B418|nr:MULTISPECIES: SDR family oxidoreductase [unclassified Nostoc]MBD2449973.1 SDR family oxidoreductase [Nostoc sp. FACHB-152]MBD2468435.1 SDR family oxidoreductase [Nostoc sp. FACHB-145]